MLKKILVPLDGSQLAETALSHATELAQKFDASLLLVWVIQSQSARMMTEFGAVSFHLEDMKRFEEDMFTHATDYLKDIQTQLEAQQINVAFKTLIYHSVADGIVTIASDEAVDLIVKTTHGRSGPSRWFFGNVAMKVLQQSPCPVYLVRVSGRDE